jgi:hypothetical protein
MGETRRTLSEQRDDIEAMAQAEAERVGLAPTTRLDAIRGKPLTTVKVVDRTRTQLEVEDCRKSGDPYETRLLVSIGSGGLLVSMTGDERQRLIAALFRFERSLITYGVQLCKHCGITIEGDDGLWWHASEEGRYRGCNRGEGPIGSETTATPAIDIRHGA